MLLVASVSATSCIGDSGDDDVAGLSEEVVVCARGTTVHGIDVSQWQGTIDWPRVAAAGKKFAFIRASHGSYEDTKFDRNWRLARDNGILRGAYQYFSPSGDAVAQADSIIRSMGTLHDDDLPPVLDVEETDGVSATTLARKIGQWVDRIESRTGRTPIVYTGKYFWNDHVSTTAYRRLPLWIAAWGPPCPDTPMGWGGWRF